MTGIVQYIPRRLGHGRVQSLPITVLRGCTSLALAALVDLFGPAAGRNGETATRATGVEATAGGMGADGRMDP